MPPKKTIEETYKKVSQREHVLLRANMYIGSPSKHVEEMWTIEQGPQTRMTKAMVEYSPGFLKIFDEVLTNALDHSNRDDTVDKIKLDYNTATGEIVVYNTGVGIPVVKHKDHGIYVPELIFGHLLSSSNYDDTEKRTGAGVNGLGVKLANIYSTRFVVETIDSESGLKFVQEFTNNMKDKSVPKITKNSGKSYTKISFIPDYSKFGMKGLERDTVLLLNKRIFDCIACTNPRVNIYLNGEKIKGKGLIDYARYFFDENDAKRFYDIHTIKIDGVECVWEYSILPWERFEHVSFVNGNSTYQGGKHVDHIMNQIVSKLKTLLETKKKLKDIKPSMIKERMFLFLRATVVNPQFSSQTKEYLTTQSKDFGCRIEVSDKFIDKLWKSSIIDELVEYCKLKESLDLAKSTDGKKKNKIYIPKLEDALWAGTAKSDMCTLILTEGDSAKTFALWGRSIVGPDKFGVYPLKGKCLCFETKIPLFNGNIKLAKDIQIGDILIGDDGNPRKVLTLYKGYGKMYEVFQDRGESYKVNDEHILTLCMPEHKKVFWVPSNYTWRALYWDKDEKNIKAKESRVNIKIKCEECEMYVNSKSMRRHYMRRHKDVPSQKISSFPDMNDVRVVQGRKRLEEFLSNIDDDNIIDICIQDYLNVTESLKRKLKGLRGECVNWEHKEVQLDPYVLGLWLGDTSDSQIVDYLTEWGSRHDARFRKIQSTNYSYSISSIDAPLKRLLEKYNLINDKHIPKEYLINSKETRLQLLAGIIDTDGYVCNDGTIEITQSTKHKRLIDDIVYLSHSLGFYTYVSDNKNSGVEARAYRIKISGDTFVIPTLLPRKQSRSTTQYNMRNSTGTIKVKSIDDGNYVGIGVDGNSRFLVNDFTVTHNCLNVRDASIQQLINNEEINNLKQIIGLKQDVEYKDTSDLRYGKVMVLTDADVDGSHIKGLLINFFHAQWPSLIKKDFIQTLKTPIVKAIKGKGVIEFYTEQDYNKWKESSATDISKYQIRYYKGLGTSTKEDAKNTFKKFSELKVDYYHKDNKCDESILLAFEKDKNVKTEANEQAVKCSDKRKKWLSGYDKNSYLDIKETRVTYQDFIHKELVHFSIYDNLRSIPSLCDGLKPSQRKILFYMLKKNINKSIKVAQLSGYVSAETSYHHGEASLQQAIVGMAQNFVGSNNINLLFPDGNHGSRLSGGKDAASPRYIFTRLSEIAQHIFHPHDTPLLQHLNDDGMEIEPEWYIPVIPMILVNGCEGIGTGYSTFVPPHNPKDIINNIFRLFDGKDPLPMKPYFHGFSGRVEDVGSGSYVSHGTWERLSDCQIKITELPIGTWVTTYKEYLESLVENGIKKDKDAKKKKNGVVLKDVRNQTKDENTGIDYIVEFKNKTDLDNLVKSGLVEKELKLSKCFNTNNMYLFDDSCIPTKYANTLDILCDFYDIRLDFYTQRKKCIQNRLEQEMVLLKSKARFIEEYITGVLDINRKSKDYIINLLEERKYHKTKPNAGENEDSGYDYLTRLPIISMTSERINSLKKQIQDKTQELVDIKNKSNIDLWKEDLKMISKCLG